MASSYQHEKDVKTQHEKDLEALLAGKGSIEVGEEEDKEEGEEDAASVAWRQGRMHVAMSLTLLVGLFYAYVLLFWG